MRVKLTAKHPRPAAPDRAPVRSGSASSRKPTRPDHPAAGKTARAHDASRPPVSGAAGSTGPTASEARAPRASAKRAAPAGAGARKDNKARTGTPQEKRPYAERQARGDRKHGHSATARPAGARRDTPERARGEPGDSRGRPANPSRPNTADRPARDATRGGFKGDSAAKRAVVTRENRSSELAAKRSTSGEPAAKRPASERGARRDAAPRERTNRADSDPRPSARQYAQRPTRSNDGAKPAPKPRPSASHTAAVHAKPVASPSETGVLRLSKRMSELGLCSRREADEWIEQGWVLVDGERIDTLGAKVHPGQRIEIVANARAAQAKQVTILLHKPIGYVSGQAEDGYQPAITLVTPGNHWDGDRSNIPFSASHLRRLAPAGRLDIDSTGMLVLTQDGRVAKSLIGIHSPIEKEYLVRVSYDGRTADIDQHFPADRLAQLRHGLSLDNVELKPAKVSWQNGEQLRFVLREGKKRQIRRMCELVGLEVVGLKRIRMGRIPLGQLPPGQWRYLLPNEEF
jgi:23S rRNA pseudouridine2604 synthase